MYDTLMANIIKYEEAGAELCQAQAKLGSPASSLSLTHSY